MMKRKAIKRMKATLKWAGRVVTYLLLAFFALILYLGVSSRIAGGPPTIFGHEMYVVLSGSMVPTFQVGSVIFDTPHINPATLKVGEMITFKAPYTQNMLITHRIIQVIHRGNQLLFHTKGDANKVADFFLVPSQNVVAQYDNFTVPYVGYYLEFVKTKLGMALTLIIPGALLIISQMVSLTRSLRKELRAKEVAPTKSEV